MREIGTGKKSGMDSKMARLAFTGMVAAQWIAASHSSHAMGYSLVDDGWWPADVRNRIIAAMDEAVSTYNANGYFNTWIYVQYHPAVPTAEANYPDYLKFGGSISARVAMHEIAHTLGSGTTWQWNANFTNGIWTGSAASHFMKLYDGRWGELHQSGVHYWPYGLNYDNEDGARERIRMVRLLSAMRADMGLDGGADADGDGLPNEWEMFKIGNLSQTGAGDTDGDGISNYDEWRTESDPLRPCPVKHGHTYVIRSKLSQKVMEAADATAGANVRQNPYIGTSLQKWTANYVGEGYWMFINQAGGHALEVGGFSTNAGGNINTWTNLGLENQKWRIVPDGAIHSKLFNRFSMHMVADVEGGPTATGDGVNISQFHDTLGATNQDWVFDEVTPGELAGGLVAEYKLDGNTRDFSGRNFHGTPTGGITYPPGRVDGLAATFNGSNGTISIPASVDTNFSIACWVKTTATGGGNQWYNGMGLVDAEVAGVAADFGLALVGNKAAFGVGKTDVTITSTSAINDGAWHHLTATLDTSSGAMKLYVDGVLQTSSTGPAGARTAPAKFSLGSIAGTTGFFNGSLDEVRVYNTLLSQSEITRLAGVGQTMVASYAFDTHAQDAGKHGNHGDPVAVTYGPGKVGAGAAQFDGTGSFVKIPASVTGDFSIAYWMKTTATGGTGQWWAGKAMVDAEVAGAAEDWGIALLGNKAGFGVGNTDTTILSTTPVNDGSWHHVVATRTGASGAMKLYVDGALQASATGATAPRAATSGIRVGASLNGGAFFTGAIDELKIFNYPLSQTQVAALASSLPAPWVSADIGTPGSDGYAGFSPANSTFTLIGGGSGIAGASDQFQFLSATAAGDPCAVTRVLSTPLTPSGGIATTARAGLMFRASSAANSAFVNLCLHPGGGVRFLYRDATSANVGQAGTTVSQNAPCWLKLTRAGNTFTAYYATTTQPPAAGDWMLIASHATTLPASPLGGLSLTSTNSTQVAVATFGHFAVFENTPGNIWRQDQFGGFASTGSAADQADPDGDGIVNLLERAFGLDPNQPNSSSDLPVLARDEAFLSLSYTRSLAATDLVYQALRSGDLATWTGAGVTDEPVSSNGSTERRVAKVPLSVLDPARAFLRLKVE